MPSIEINSSQSEDPKTEKHEMENINEGIDENNDDLNEISNTSQLSKKVNISQD